MVSYHREFWETDRRDPRRVVFDALNRYVESRIPYGGPYIPFELDYDRYLRFKALDLGCGRGTVTRMLVMKGYEVTAVDVDPVFLAEVKRKLPGVRTIQGDIGDLKLEETFDLATCIETAQNLAPLNLLHLLTWLRKHTRRLLINIGNAHSLYSLWLRLRRWQNPFVWTYRPDQFESWLAAEGFKLTHRKGFGLVMPMSLRRGWKWTFIGPSLASAINRLDDYATPYCHIYYLEAEVC